MLYALHGVLGTDGEGCVPSTFRLPHPAGLALWGTQIHLDKAPRGGWEAEGWN